MRLGRVEHDYCDEVCVREHPHVLQRRERTVAHDSAHPEGALLVVVVALEVVGREVHGATVHGGVQCLHERVAAEVRWQRPGRDRCEFVFAAVGLHGVARVTRQAHCAHVRLALVVKGFPWWLLSPPTKPKKHQNASILETEPSLHLHLRWAHVAPVCMPSDVRVTM